MSMQYYYNSSLYWPRADEENEWRWKPFLICVLPQIESMRNKYQAWISLTKVEQTKAKDLISSLITNHDHLFERQFRILIAILETFDEWSRMQDEKGACGFVPELTIITDNFEADLAHAMKTLDGIIRKSSYFNSGSTQLQPSTSTSMIKSSIDVAAGGGDTAPGASVPFPSPCLSPIPVPTDKDQDRTTGTDDTGPLPPFSGLSSSAAIFAALAAQRLQLQRGSIGIGDFGDCLPPSLRSVTYTRKRSKSQSEKTTTKTPTAGAGGDGGGCGGGPAGDFASSAAEAGAAAGDTANQLGIGLGGRHPLSTEDCYEQLLQCLDPASRPGFFDDEGEGLEGEDLDIHRETCRLLAEAGLVLGGTGETTSDASGSEEGSSSESGGSSGEDDDDKFGRASVSAGVSDEEDEDTDGGTVTEIRSLTPVGLRLAAAAAGLDVTLSSTQCKQTRPRPTRRRLEVEFDEDNMKIKKKQ